MLTLITSTQGNPIALKRTLDSFRDVCNEFIVGDLCVFEEDRRLIENYKNEFNLKIVPLQFNALFKLGFSWVLNELSKESTNDLVLYMNVGEVINEGDHILESLNDNHIYDTFFINHPVETHSWGRMYNKHKNYWSGLIHEELRGSRKDCPGHIFQFVDTEKDVEDEFKSAVMNTIKECVYFNNLIRLADDPTLQGATNMGWINWAKEQYDSMKERLSKKGKQYEAFVEGDLDMFKKAIYDDPEFKKERFDSTSFIEYQNSFKSL